MKKSYMPRQKRERYQDEEKCGMKRLSARPRDMLALQGHCAVMFCHTNVPFSELVLWMLCKALPG